MARPTKTGLDYYPMDVGFLRDKKVRLLRSEFGASSVLFVLYVLGKVYEGDGYFLAWDKDELLLAADELRETPAYISEVLQGCLTRSLFDERVFQMFGVLTSAGIQRRYLRGCEKRDVITIVSEYWLLNIGSKSDVPAGVRAKLTLVSVTGGNNDVNSPGNSDNSPGNPQSKVKESKVKQSKVTAPPHENWGFGEELESALSRWMEYKVEKRRPCTPTELNCLLDQVKEYVKSYGEKAVAGLILFCASNGWQSIAWDRLGKQSGSGGMIGGPGSKSETADSIKADMERMERYREKLREEAEGSKRN